MKRLALVLVLLAGCHREGATSDAGTRAADRHLKGVGSFVTVDRYGRTISKEQRPTGTVYVVWSSDDSPAFEVQAPTQARDPDAWAKQEADSLEPGGWDSGI